MIISVHLRAGKAITWVAAITAFGLGAGCRRSDTTDHAKAASGPDVVRISPSELFVNELKRPEPHLGLTTGCYRVEAPDKEMMFGSEWELWKDGKRVRWLVSSKSRVRKPDFASFSVKEVSGGKGERRLQHVASISGKEGNGAGTSSIEAPEPSVTTTMTTSMKLNGPRDLAEGEKVLAWAYVIQDVKGSQGSTIEEALGKCRWALAVKIWWEPVRNGE